MTAQFGKVGVLYGGNSSEREVSLMSGTGVLAALKSAGIDAHGFDTGQRSISDLQACGFARVFIALHGRGGEDGSLQGILEMLGIPYTGSGVMASAIAMDKLMTKRVWVYEGLPTPQFEQLSQQQMDATALRQVPDRLGLPLMLKAPHEGSTLGIVKVQGYSDMQSGFAEVQKFESIVLAEQFIEGRELTVAILEMNGVAQALPIVEILAPQGNYDFHHKYISDDTRYLCPAPLKAALVKHIQSLSLQAFHALGCEGWARVDVMLRANDLAPFLLEINTSPGMTTHSLVPMAARAAGMGYADLCVEILRSARLKSARGSVTDGT
jgi:D-alanine-D-alanine ligase